jgi:hypothetical protein
MNAFDELNDLNVPNDDRITALTHLRIDALTPERTWAESTRPLSGHMTKSK